jgi:hypothetical protein
MSVNILFYSRNCKTSIHLLNIMQNENLINYFRLFCVDERLGDVPPNITTVPTIIMANTHKIFVANDCFKCIENIKFITNQNKNYLSQSDLNKKLIQNTNTNRVSGPVGFLTQEMGGFSDSFAYKDVDKAQPHSFFGYKTEQNNTIYTAPRMGAITEVKQKSLLHNLKTIREDQNNNFKTHAREEQYNSILKEEQSKLMDNINVSDNTNQIRNIMKEQQNHKQLMLQKQQQYQMMMQNMSPQQRQQYLMQQNKSQQNHNSYN